MEDRSPSSQLYAMALYSIPRLDFKGSSPNTFSLPDNHCPRRSKDSALTAFAQLACIRLGARHATISLFDSHRQYILAEATPEAFLQPGLPDDISKTLWLGTLSIPRGWGVCEEVLEIDSFKLVTGEDAVVIINDLARSSMYAKRDYVVNCPKVRFYIGVPLMSFEGAIVGALGIFDNKAREELPKSDLHHVYGIAATIMTYMEKYSRVNFENNH